MNALFNWIFDSQTVDEIKYKFYTMFSVLASLTLSLYTLVAVYNERYDIAVIDVILASFNLVVTLFAIKDKSLKLYATIGLIPLFIFSLFNFINGGLTGDSVLWTYVTPLIIFFMAPKARTGIVVILSYLFLTFLYFYFIDSKSSHPQYDLPKYGIYILSFLSVSLLSLLFKKAWDFSNHLYQSNSQNVIESNEELNVKIVELEKLKKQLEKTNTDLKKSAAETEKINKIMINRELSMIKLKDRIKELESTKG